MDKPQTPRFVKTAAAVSQMILAVWAILLLLSWLFQKNILTDLTGGSMPEDMEKVFLYSGMIMFMASLAVTFSNYLVSKGNGVFIPLVISSVTTGILPIAVFISNNVQTRFIAVTQGSEALAAMSIYANAVDLLSYLLYAAAVITIAASAVYAYANDPMNKSSERT